MPAFAVALVPRADEDGHVHRDRGARGIGKEQQPEAVVELILGDAFDGGDLFGLAFFRLGGSGDGSQQRNRGQRRDNG